MNSIANPLSKASRMIRGRIPPKLLLLRRGISTRELDASKGDRERVVILGSGWAGFVLSRELDTKKFQTVVVSPRSYFVFTPLLASTAVGTLEFRTTLESVRARRSDIEFIQGWANDVSFNDKMIEVEESTMKKYLLTTSRGSHEANIENRPPKGRLFSLNYDKLVVAVGSYSQTFNTPGVKQNALFLKDVSDAIKIRKRILDCFETASLPTTSPALAKSLLNFAVVGGGPTGVEFAAELFDLCNEDLKRLYPTLIPFVKISIYDVAPKILPMFDSKLADYAIDHFKRDGIKVKTNHNILELRPGLPEGQNVTGGDACFTLKTKQEGEIGIGMCVWSTGLMMNPFVQQALDDVHIYPSTSTTIKNPSSVPPTSEEWIIKRDAKTGGLIVDDHFRTKLVPRSSAAKGTNGRTPVATMQNVFALGDVSVMEGNPLPATAQVANQEAKWLGRALNKGFTGPGFTFRNLGVMTYLGDMRAIMQTGGHTEIKGRTAWLIWRGAYLTQTISWRNKLLIPIYWMINWLFGRDISRF